MYKESLEVLFDKVILKIFKKKFILDDSKVCISK